MSCFLLPRADITALIQSEFKAKFCFRKRWYNSVSASIHSIPSVPSLWSYKKGHTHSVYHLKMIRISLFMRDSTSSLNLDVICQIQCQHCYIFTKHTVMANPKISSFNVSLRDLFLCFAHFIIHQAKITGPTAWESNSTPLFNKLQDLKWHRQRVMSSK